MKNIFVPFRWVIVILAKCSMSVAFAPQLSLSQHRTTAVYESFRMIPSGMEDSIQLSFPTSSTVLSTISADIDNIPTNEFATVFAGGIGVMIGSVIAVLIVGLILESGNSYANIVADSYAQGGDEAFWASLSAEDKEKAEDMIAKLRKSKEDADTSSFRKDDAVEVVGSKQKKLEIFSDYED